MSPFSSQGKTTLVNCLRGLPDARKTADFVYKEDDPAPIDFTQTTTKPTRYRWPANFFPYVAIWDMSSGDTPKHPTNTYFQDNQLHRFACLLLLINERFTEFDIAICRQAVQYEIPVIMVITKVGQVVDSERKFKEMELERKLTEHEFQEVIHNTVGTLKNNIARELQEHNINQIAHIPLFVIEAHSFRQPDLYNCPPLETEQLLDYCMKMMASNENRYSKTNTST